MAEIKGGLFRDEVQEGQGNKKNKRYQKKYKDAKKKNQKQKTKNKLLRQETKYTKKIQTEREARCKLEGKLEAYQEILERFSQSAHLHNLPESVIEIEGDVRDV